MAISSLALEEHVFRMAENQSRLFSFLDAAAPLGWNWGVDFTTGLLTFDEKLTGRVIAQSPTFLLGSYSEGNNTFLWGWLNRSPGLDLPPEILARVTALQQTAQQENRPAFLATNAIPVQDGGEAMGLALTAAGYLGCATFYGGGYEGGTAFLAVTDRTAIDAVPADAQKILSTLTHTIAGISFDHRKAVLAYLGEPPHREGETWKYPVGNSVLHLRFDAQGRLAEMQGTLRAVG